MSRPAILRSIQTAMDLFVLSAALWLAFQLRFDWHVPPDMLRRFILTWPYVVAWQYAVLALLGITRFSWRYVGLLEARRIFGATAIGSGLLGTVRIVANLLPLDGVARHLYLPFGVIAIDLALALIGTVGVRTLRRISAEHAELRGFPAQGDTKVLPTLLVGAGSGGVMVAKEIARRPQLGILPIGFIDDDPLKLGSVIHGLRVLGTTTDIGRIARQRGARQAIVTIANAPGSTVRAIASVCQDAGLRIKVIPGLFQLVGGEVNLTRMRDVAIEDLLRREPVVLDEDAISKDLRGKIVLVSGAGGSIGSEICRQVCRFGPRKLVLLERSENALFEAHREVTETFSGIEVVPLLADICDGSRIADVFSRHRPEIVFHAAAHKHVPMMEWNPGEALRNNVFGTQTLADSADAHGVDAFVMISTDKAVNPASVMGATKRVAELYIQALAETSKTRFVTVRFGNVLDSNGSVVPIFREQIARGGPVTVTHPDMKRYFMTIPEACKLVLQAAAMGEGGEIFILDMGEPIKIVELARDLIQLSGFGSDEIEIVFTGIRPGEKLHEELCIAEEHTEKTRHPNIFIGKTRAGSIGQVRARLVHLASVARMASSSPEDVRAALRTFVPEYQTEKPPSDPAQRPEFGVDDQAIATPTAGRVRVHALT
jgi:FlaA1/EpsC-like NDP-sugar epimerase